MQISKWVALGVAAFCLVAVGGVVNMPHLYYMAAMLITLPCVSYLLGWYTLRGLTFTRRAPASVWEGEDSHVTYVAQNASPIARFFVSIIPPRERFVLSREMNPSLFNVAARSTVEVRNSLRYNRRGVYKFNTFDVSALDPLGVFTFTRTVTQSDETVVYPMPRSVGSIMLRGSSNAGWNDAMNFTRNGDGVDTAGVREYRPGDPLRYIHWRQTARTGDLTVIEFEETQSVNLRIVLDTASIGVVGEEPDTSLEYAVRVAATLARDGVQSGVGVELLTAGGIDGGSVPAWNGLAGERGQARLYRIMDALARVEKQSTMPVSDLLASSVDSLDRGTTLVVIALVPDERLADVFARYVAAGSVPVLICIDIESFPGARQPVAPSARHAVTAIAAMGAPAFTIGWSSAGDLHALPVDGRTVHV